MRHPDSLAQTLSSHDRNADALRMGGTTPDAPRAPRKQRSNWLRAIIAAVIAAIALTISVSLAASLGVGSRSLGQVTRSVSVQECTLTAQQDSYVRNNRPTTNYGTANRLFTRPQTAAGNNIRRTFVLMSVGTSAAPVGVCAETGAPIVTGATIRSAELRLWMFNDPTNPRSVDAELVSTAAGQSWNESSITWNNQAAIVSGTAFSTALPVGSGVAVFWDVSGSVQDIWAGTTNHGWRLKDANETSGGNSNNAYLARFRSSEWGNAAQNPKLVIGYEP